MANVGPATAPEVPQVYVGSVRLASVSFDKGLDAGEVIASVSTPVETGTSDLTISNEAVSTSALTISGNTVATGRAIQFKYSGQLAGVTYVIFATVVTDSSPAQTLLGRMTFTGVVAS